MEPENYLNVKKLKLKYTDIFDSYNLRSMTYYWVFFDFHVSGIHSK